MLEPFAIGAKVIHHLTDMYDEKTGEKLFGSYDEEGIVVGVNVGLGGLSDELAYDVIITA